MQKFRWWFPVLLSSTLNVGCGLFQPSETKKSLTACETLPAPDVAWKKDAMPMPSYNYRETQNLPFKNCQNIYAYLKNQKDNNQNCSVHNSPMMTSNDQKNGSQHSRASHAPQEMSDQSSVASSDILTNLRERGVDEADIAKISKDHIFVASAGKVAVLDRKSKQIIGLLKTSDSANLSSFQPMMKGGTSPKLLTKDEKLVVATDTKIQVYDLTAMKMPALKEEIALSQPASELRLIGSRLVVLSQNYATELPNHFPVLDNQSILSLPCQSTYPNLTYPPSSQGFSATVVKSMDLNNLKNEKSFAFLDSLHSYITTKNIYLYGYDYSRAVTFIRKISLNEQGDLSEVATGSVPGTIKDSWAISESGSNGEYLSVVSTLRSTNSSSNGTVGNSIVFSTSRSTSSSQLSILEAKKTKLALVGTVGEFGIGEEVKSVRKIGNIVFAVTFKEIDPLFAIDISDVTSPKILSSLKIPGFSTYMHPFGSNRLIGLGYSDSSRFNSSVQLSLFDTSELTDVRRLDAISIGGPASSSAATVDYHAFFMDQENALVGIPVENYSTTPSVPCGSSNLSPDPIPDRFRPVGCLPPVASPTLSSGKVASTTIAPARYPNSGGAALFKIGETSIKAFKFIHHDDITIKATTSLSLSQPVCPFISGTSKILRLMKVDNQLVSISENAIKSFELTDDLPLAASASWDSPQTSCRPPFVTY